MNVGTGGTMRTFCVFDQSRFAPVRDCQCPNCTYRREYKRIKQRIYSKRHAHRWTSKSYEYHRARYLRNRTSDTWCLAVYLYASIRRQMIDDNAWPVRGN